MSIDIIIATLNNDLESLHCLLDPVSEKNQKLNPEYTSDINFQEQSYGNTALHYAVKRGNLKMIETLLHYGANRNIKNFSGVSALEEYENQTIDPVFYYHDEYISIPKYIEKKREYANLRKNDSFNYYSRNIRDVINFFRLRRL